MGDNGNIIGFEPVPFCDFCGRTADQLSDGGDYLIVSQRNRHATICTVCLADIVDAVVRKAQEDGMLPSDEEAIGDEAE